MRTLKLTFLAAMGLALAASTASAGPITSTIGGLPSVSVSAGAIVVVNNVITFGPTTVGGVGAGIEISFDYTGGVASGAAGEAIPAGWFDLQPGAPVCAAGHCENINAAGDLFGAGVQFLANATFALASITIDTTGLAPGAYSYSAGLTGPADDIFASAGLGSVAGEYFSVAAVINIVPEPGTAALMGLGLGILGIAGRRR